MTFEQAAQHQLERMVTKGLKKSTIEAAESAIRVYLVPFFGQRSLEKINREDVRAFVLKLVRKGLAPKSIKNYVSTLHSIFELGVQREWVVSNPSKGVELPRGNQSEELRFLSLEELEALLRSAHGCDRMGRVEHVLYVTAAMTGLRQSELLALRWRDVDWVSKRIRVRRAYVRGVEGPPKSKRAVRAVPMIQRVAAELDGLSRWSSYTDEDSLGFGHPATGTPLDRSKVLKRFKVCMRHAGLAHRLGREGGINFHSFRHTYGTAMAAANVPMRTLQEWLGHRDYKTVLIYADYAPNAHEVEWAEQAFVAGTVSGTNLSEPARTQESPDALG